MQARPAIDRLVSYYNFKGRKVDDRYDRMAAADKKNFTCCCMQRHFFYYCVSSDSLSFDLVD